jgi:hypothetical protein
VTDYEVKILPVCYCAEHDGEHVHVPRMVDSQYGLPIVAVGEPPTLTPSASHRDEGRAPDPCVPDHDARWLYRALLCLIEQWETGLGKPNLSAGTLAMHHCAQGLRRAMKESRDPGEAPTPLPSLGTEGR